MEALVQRNLEEAELDFHRIRHSSDPRKACARPYASMSRTWTAKKARSGARSSRLPFRRPEIAALMERMESQYVPQYHRGAGRILPACRRALPKERFAPQARLIMMLIQGLSAMKARTEGDPLPGRTATCRTGDRNHRKTS